MGYLMWLDYTVCLLPSLYAFHDNRVSVTLLNPITPTWSDTNSITYFLLSTHLSLFLWFPGTHSVTSGLFFYSLMSCKSCLFFYFFISLSFISLFCLSAQKRKLTMLNKQMSNSTSNQIFLSKAFKILILFVVLTSSSAFICWPWPRSDGLFYDQ